MIKQVGCCVLMALGCAGQVHSASIAYQGNLTSGVPVTGSVGGFSWSDEVAAGVDFWRFSGQSGDTVNLSATRASSGLDPAFSLYYGVTTADESAFLNDSDWGGLLYLTFADDEIDNAGAGGDPALTSFALPFSGNYTVAVGGFQSATASAYGYSLSFVSQPIPEPATALLWAAGLAALVAGLGRRRSAA